MSETHSESPGALTTSGGRVKTVVMWVVPLILLPALMLGAIKLSTPKVTAEELRNFYPLEVGTTWVYDTFDHGEPAGPEVKRVMAEALTGDDALSTVAVTTHYDDYLGQGPNDSLTYFGLTEQSVLQYALYSNHEYQPIDPPAPAYELPIEEGKSWEYTGTVGNNELHYEVTLEDIEDVEASGKTFAGCAHYTSEFLFTVNDVAGNPQEVEEWVCPGYGSVKTHSVVKAQDFDLTEELVAFQGVDRSWTATEPDAADATDTEGSIVGFNAARTNAVEGEFSDTLAWSQALNYNFSFPPVTDGSVMVTADETGEVAAMDTTTGEMKWRTRLTGPIVAAPTVAGASVLIADAEKNVWALSMEDGSTQWAKKFGDITSSVTASEDRAFVVTDDMAITAVSLADGSAIWSGETGALARTAPAISGDLVVAADEVGDVTAFDTADGSTRWSKSTEGELMAGPLIAGNHVLAADDAGTIYSYNLEDGELQWESRLNLNVTEAMAAGEGRVVVVAGSTRLEAFDLESGDHVWDRRVGNTNSGPAIVGSDAISVTNAGNVSVTSLDDGSVHSEFGLPMPTPDSRVTADLPFGLIDGSLVINAFVSAEAHTVSMFAYPVTEDAKRAGVSFDTEIRAFPSSSAVPGVLSGGTLFVPGQDKVLYRSDGLNDVSEVLESEGLQPGLTLAGDILIAQQDQEVQALPLDGGEPLWSFPATDPFPGSTPTVGGDTVYIPEYGLGLAAADRATGTPLWFKEIQNAIGTMPPLPLPDGDVAYGSGSLARYDGATGDVKWSIKDTQLFNNLAYEDGTLFADLVRNEHTAGLAAVDADTGEIKWQYPNSNTQIVVGPAVSVGVVIYPDSQGTVSALDAATGEVLWQVHLYTPIGGVPVIVDGRVFITETGREEDLNQREFRVSVHDLHTGAFLGSYEPPGLGYQLAPSVGGTPDGTLLVPATSRLGSIVILMKVHQ